MKVVLFCGGLGLRLREYSDTLPKPMVPVGKDPVLLHVMKYYAHFGHTDFILCLGYKGEVIKDYFFDRGATLVRGQDQVLGNGESTQTVSWHGWRVTFAPTGQSSNIGDRLLCVRTLLKDEETFLANYSDDLTDAPLDVLIAEFHERQDLLGSFLAVKPNLSFHVVVADAQGTVTDILAIRETPIRVNGGYFILRPQIFEFMRAGEELVEEPFERLIKNRALRAYEHDGFWGPMDTLKDYEALEQMNELGTAPWKVWESSELIKVKPSSGPSGEYRGLSRSGTG